MTDVTLESFGLTEQDVDDFYDATDPMAYEGECNQCEDGMILVCPDDLCRGDGGCYNYRKVGCYKVCTNCKGEGRV